MNIGRGQHSVRDLVERSQYTRPNATALGGHDTSDSGRIEIATVSIAFEDRARRSADVVADIDLVMSPVRSQR